MKSQLVDILPSAQKPVEFTSEDNYKPDKLHGSKNYIFALHAPIIGFS